MGRRIDHLDDPDAPAANSLVPSVNTIVRDDTGRILLIRRTDNDRWSLPGGKIDLGESLVQAAVRETREETGIDCQITGIAGIYSNPRHLVEYTSDGEVRQEFTIVLTATPTGGKPTTSNESSHVEWVDPTAVDQHPMHPATAARIEDHLRGRPPHLD